MERGGKRRGLGRGLGALIPAPVEPEETEQAAVQWIPIEEIRPNPYQPRREFSPDTLMELSESIKQHGLLQPIVVRLRNGVYELIAGERRLRAAQLAGLTSIPALVRDADDQASLAVALIENLQRENLNPIEEALAFRRLQQDFGLTQTEIAEQVGKSRSAVANSMRLLQLPPDVQEDIATGRLTAGHARAILTLDNPEEQRKLAQSLLASRTSVREAETISRRKVRQTADPNWEAAETALCRALGLKARLRPRADGSGKLEIEYPTLEALNQLLERLGVAL